MNRPPIGPEPTAFETALESLRRLETTNTANLSERIQKVYLSMEENQKDIARLKELHTRLERVVLPRGWL